MKKVFIVFALISAVSFAAPAKGGVGPCLATCCFGPRAGVQMNEGTKIRNMEWMALVANAVASPLGTAMLLWDPITGESMNSIKQDENLGGPQILAKAPENKGGINSCLIGYCFGPRVALEANDGRKIRTLEWIALVPVVNIVPTVIMLNEAYTGKTMSEIAAEEGLDK